MKKYEPTLTKHILENPILSPNNFQKIFDDFTIFLKNNNNNLNNQNNQQNNNNIQKDEIFITFGKNKINSGDLSPIPSSSDSQKNKLSLNSDKFQDNFLSPIPLDNNINPIIKEINTNNFSPIDIKPPLQKNNFNEIKTEIPNKEIKYNNQDKNKNYEKIWRKFAETLKCKKLIDNHFNDENKNMNFFNFISKNVITKLLIFYKKNDLFNENDENMNSPNNNDISTDMKILNEPTSKIETTAKIIPTNNSLDDIVDNSNFYYIDKENNEQQPHPYKPTNIQNILNLNSDTIYDQKKFESIINIILAPKIIPNEEQDDKKYNDMNKNLMYTIKEEEEEKYDHDSKNPTMKNFSFGINLSLNKARENKDNHNQLNLINNNEIKNEKEISNPFLSNNSENIADKENKIESENYSEFFKPQPTNLNNIELKMNNLNTNDNDNSNTNNNENQNGFLFKNIINKENLKNDINNDNNENSKNNFDKLFKEPYQIFSFGKNDLNNIINKEDSQKEKADLNQNNKDNENNIIFTFDKNKNENEKNVEVKEFENNKSKEGEEEINNDNMENIGTEKLIDNKINIINSSESDNKNKENDAQFFSFKPHQEKMNENIESPKNDSNNKEQEIILNTPKEEEKADEKNNINNSNEIKNNTLKLFDNNLKKEEENIPYPEIDKNMNMNENEQEKKDELETKEEKDKNINLERKEINNNNNNNPDEIIKNNTIKLINDEQISNINSDKEIETDKKIIIDEKIIINNSDCQDENSSKKIDYNKYINSPEVFSSLKTKSFQYNNNINIRSNLFDIKLKIISMNQIKNLQKLYPNFKFEISNKNINKDFLKYFLNDYNEITFTNNINDINKTKYKIKLRSYFNILKKLKEKIFYFYDSLLGILINSTLNQIESIKKQNNINSILLITDENNNDILEEMSEKEMKKAFSNMDSNLKRIKNYYENINNKKKIENNIFQLREEFKENFTDVIWTINKKYEHSPINKIKFYQKVIDDIKSFGFKNNSDLKKNNNNKTKNEKNSKKGNKLWIEKSLMIYGLTIPIVIILISIIFFY